MKHPRIVFVSIALVLVVAGVMIWRSAPSSSAQSADVSTHIKTEAQKCGQAMMHGDFQTIATLMNKRVLDLAGGQEAVVATLTKGMAELKTKGMAFEDVTVGTPQPVQEINSLQISVVPYQLVMKVPDHRLRVEANMLAISEDHGKSWGILDLSGNMDQAAFFKLFPELDGKFTIPQRNEPVVEPAK